MVDAKSLDDSYSIIAALLCDVQDAHGLVFNTRALDRTLKKVRSRTMAEGMGFLTKTLPRLGKAFDKALTEATKLNASSIGFDSSPGCEYPRFLGELFSLVLRPDGGLLPSPCVSCIRDIRQVCYLFYKYELNYTDEQEQKVISKFKQTEIDLADSDIRLQEIEAQMSVSHTRCWWDNIAPKTVRTARKAKDILSRLFLDFDPADIVPRHGPGAVATKQRLWEKYQWTNVARRITEKYPFDSYFKASIGHVCDTYDDDNTITDEDLPARVCLVPKDSRGPRLISCEPVDFQWVQQGLGRAIVSHVEKHWTSRFNVFFSDQQPNKRGALLGSSQSWRDNKCLSLGRYATLDLNEASDRVSVGLVRLLFPPHLYEYLEACRSLSTVLPDGEVLTLRKFAPMGSALCFPIMALTIWAILTALAPDADTRESILVYGDDVIVPTAFAADAIEQLESFGLKVNRDKSCITGFFRESCGTDAFKGVDVTPVRLRTVWSSSPSPEVYTSWIAYANSFYDRSYLRVYNLIVERLHRCYGAIPDDGMCLSCPSLRFVPEGAKPTRSRFNPDLQRLEWNVWDVRSPTINKKIDGWSMLLRYFVNAPDKPCILPWVYTSYGLFGHLDDQRAFRVGQYTDRRTSMLVRRWR